MEPEFGSAEIEGKNYNLAVLPLLHKRILITRTRTQGSDLAAQLESLGATCVVIPAIEIIPPSSFDSLDDAVTRLESFDWLLFTSVNAVEAWVERLSVRGVRAPGLRLPRIAVIGPATARAVQAAGFTVDLMPGAYVAESLSAALIPYALGAGMLLIRAAEARDHLPEALTAAGARVTIAEAYRNRMPSESIPMLQHVFSAPALVPDAITFTSASTVRNLVSLLEAAKVVLPSGIVLASIGPITSQALRDAGLEPDVEASTATMPALVECLIAGLRIAGVRRT